MALANTTVARPYAKALFAQALVDQTLMEWSAQLALLAQLCLDVNAQKLIADPLIAAEQKANFLIDICGKHLGEQGKNLVHLLASNKRLGVIADIKQIYEQLLAEKNQTQKVTVISASLLDNSAKETLTKALQKHLNCKVEATWEEDARILGGALIAMSNKEGNFVIDGSVRGQLIKLTRQLIA